MSRAKLLIENFLAYGLINVLNKVIPLLLLPVITRLLSNPSDFGVYDMYNLIVNFGSPLVMLGIYDAMFREYFEKEDGTYRKNVTATANKIILMTSIIVSFILIIFNQNFSNLFFGESIYGGIVILSAVQLIFSANSTIIAAPTRIQNKRKIYVISGLTQSLTYYILAIILIYLGYSYYGMIYANIISTIIIVIFFWKINNKFFTLGKFDKKIAKELLKIGLPLLPTFLIYWVFNSMDRIMITKMLGTTELGIYAVGSKVASISTLIYGAFAGGWQYFAFSTMRDNDYKKMMGKIWEVMFVISSCFFVGAFLFKDLIFNMLFVGEYRLGVVVFPYLLFAPLLQMLYQILSTQFQVEKKTYFSPIMLLIGALVNLVLNFYLIPLIGVKGAAIATFMGFAISLVITFIIVVCRKKWVEINLRTYIILFLFTLIFIILNIYDFSLMSKLLGIIYILINIIIYFLEIPKMLREVIYVKKN